MSAVARYPPDSFLPTGARDNSGAHLPFNGMVASGSDSSSVISPLALPRGAMGYFDHLSPVSHLNSAASSNLARTNGRAANLSGSNDLNVNNSTTKNRAYSPLSPSFRANPFPQPHPPQFLSPHLAPTAREAHYKIQPQPRSSSLSPTYLTGGQGGDGARVGLVTSPGRVERNELSIDGIAGGFLDAASPLQAGPGSIDAALERAQLQNVQRLLQQNARIRGAWEAERKYLEANRERAEEVYKEEQALMEEDRTAWEAERSQLFQQIQELRQERTVDRTGWEAERASWQAEKIRLLEHIEVLERNIASQGPAIESSVSREFSTAVDQPTPSQPAATAGMVGGGDASIDSRAAVAFHPQAIQTDVGTQGQGQIRSPSSGETVVTVLHVPANIPGPAVTSTDAMASLEKEESGPVSIVDVQEIHPDLEGIPIRAHAIQKPTFKDSPSQPGSRVTSRTPSPTEPGKPSTVKPEDSGVPRETSETKKDELQPATTVETDASGPASTTKLEPRQETLRLLAEDESDRLTMHAGHTPILSLSLVPTTNASRVSSGAVTPIVAPAAVAGSSTFVSGASEGKSLSSAFEPTEPNPTLAHPVPPEEGYPEELFEPLEERLLKGPLMIRNVPATDEIFLRKLSDKLEVIRQSPEIAIPAVLKDSPVYEDSDHKDDNELPGHGDGANEKGKGRDEGEGEAGGSADDSRHDKSPQVGADELEIPLKIKKSNNFGAPFGVVR